MVCVCVWGVVPGEVILMGVCNGCDLMGVCERDVMGVCERDVMGVCLGRNEGNLLISQFTPLHCLGGH